MLDEKTLRAKTLMREAKNVRRMVNELSTLRQQKIVKTMVSGETVATDRLSQEEEKLVKGIAPPLESFQEMSKELLSGHLQQASSTQKPKQRILRFLKETPAVIGADMKTYGPFKPEDVASIPQENARILVKQGIAVEVEVKL